jgi:hypothetical protein
MGRAHENTQSCDPAVLKYEPPFFKKWNGLLQPALDGLNGVRLPLVDQEDQFIDTCIRRENA